jgi:hypothetical protein
VILRLVESESSTPYICSSSRGICARQGRYNRVSASAEAIKHNRPSPTHVVLVHDLLVVGSGVLVLLVLGDQVLQVGLGLGELAASVDDSAISFTCSFFTA